MERRLEAIASNIANVNTAGYRAAGVKFETAMADVGDEQVAYRLARRRATSSATPGPISYTGNSLDVAVDGEGWFALQTPSGTVYTRDGRMHMTDHGDLQSVDGYRVLDTGGGADHARSRRPGRSRSARTARISQGGKPVGAIGLFLIPAGRQAARATTTPA